ncbi:sugar ABC transporter substrate-binding protein [Nocardioides flavus (ex Wang et al. 2016)]|uniref:Sugar ABC transporter substrate-binding protein n=1 Tax=Nocardioides flavus (ex Wang et al. 2016) TaxID=2058780 RepID=A0ABQ3HKL8_9ACTN|nr:extracellular solute-binding protein [Nocardioides flavus (ex Wang et al. 2016)]GHE18238.1 sugar ABC transporter substrate-binding protein [Nocardioides flavus (ex Wang et al. 2016)]
MSRLSFRRRTLAASVLALALTTAACTSDAEPAPAPSPSPDATGQPVEKPRKITFGAYGTEEEVAAFQSVVDSFNATSTTRQVTLRSWPDHESALQDVLAGNAPDAFLTSSIDLDQLVEADALQPVSLLLDERGVDFGDRFSRDAVDAFAMDDELQCMAYSVSPMVVYYNTDIVDFDKMERRELDVPTVSDEGVRERWTLAEFGAAAEFASRRGDRRGVWIDPTLQGLTPFIHSGGGQVFDDDEEPTSLAFSDESTREALGETLAILRNAALTPTNAQLARATPVQLFKRGELAMIAGFRNLVPELRDAEDLDFDVLPMPTIEDRATVGDISGLCLSAGSENVGDAADFIAYAVSDAAIATVASTGYIVPANTSVAASDDFLAPGLEPANAAAFNSSIRYMVVPPFVDQREELVEAVTPLLERLVTAPGVLDLEETTEQIDQASRTVLSPEEETESPTEEPSESPSE